MRIFHDVFILGSVFFWCTSASKSPGDSENVQPRRNIPLPLVITPSQYWDGVDGEWSTFALRVGVPAQNVRAIVSTNSPQTIVVAPEGCTSNALNPVPDDCATARGGVFDMTTSTTWKTQGNFAINSDVGFEANLGYKQNASYGLETLGLGFAIDGPTLKNQTVSRILSAKPFYTGIFGLGTQPVNYSDIGNFSAPSYFTSLKSDKIIPSLSWSYTAGAKHQEKAGQVAQLIFGGYDASRFVPNQASFSLAPDVNRDLVVAIQSITYRGASQKSLLSKPTYAFIESTDPNIWLPEEACHQFEQAYGLSVDNATGLYLMNETQVSQLKHDQPKVAFTLANSLSGGQTVNIELPIGALTLKAAYPFIKSSSNATHYFPLRKSKNDSQNTLGRAFLQEAYLTVDYEQNNFTVSQCSWGGGATPNMVSIISADYLGDNSSNSTTPNNKATSGPKRLSPGVVAAIAISVASIVITAAALVFFIIRRRNKSLVPLIHTEHINLTHVEPADAYDKPLDAQSLQSFPSPAPVYQRFHHNTLDDHFAPSVPRIELPTAANDAPSIHHSIHQLPDHDNRASSDYSAAMNAMRAATTPEIGGESFNRYELAGHHPTSITELDDEESRQRLSPGLSPAGSPRTLSATRGSPRLPSPMSPLSPWNTFYDDHSDAGSPL